MTLKSIKLFIPKPKKNPAGIDNFSSSLTAELRNSCDVEVFCQSKKLLTSLKNFFLLKKDQQSNSSFLLSTNTKLPIFIPKQYQTAIVVHDLVIKKFPKTMNRSWLSRKSHSLDRAIKKANCVFAVSQSTANDIVEFFPEYAQKVRVIMAAGFISPKTNISPNKTPIHLPTKKPFLLSVCTIEPRKNLKRLLEAYSGLPESLKEKYPMVLTGCQGWESIKLKEIIQTLNLSAHVFYLGYVSKETLEALYQKAYALVMPSLYEGFGIPIIEANSFGIPVITSNTSSMPEVAGQSALLVDPYDISSIKSQIQTLLENSNLRESLSKKALINTQRFSWGETVKIIRKTFEELLSKNNA